MKKLKFSISWKSALYSNIILFVKREKYFSMKHIPNIILFPSFFQTFFLIECQITTNGKMKYIPCILVYDVIKIEVRAVTTFSTHTMT